MIFRKHHELRNSISPLIRDKRAQCTSSTTPQALFPQGLLESCPTQPSPYKDDQDLRAICLRSPPFSVPYFSINQIA